jgi:hypothetical protein
MLTKFGGLVRQQSFFRLKVAAVPDGEVNQRIKEKLSGLPDVQHFVTEISYNNNCAEPKVHFICYFVGRYK